MNNSLIKSAAPAASGNNELIWHLCLLRHYRSWEYIKPLTENALWWPLFPSLSTSTETRRLIMIIYLLITFTYISRRTVGGTVCRLEELIEVFFISASRIQTQNAKLGCQVFVLQRENKQTRWWGGGAELKSTQQPLRHQRQSPHLRPHPQKPGSRIRFPPCKPSSPNIQESEVIT